MAKLDNHRDRFKLSLRGQNNEDDLFKVWDDQKRMQKEDKKLELELIETKKRARELRKTLLKNKFGESNSKIKDLAEKSRTNLKPLSLKLYQKVRSPEHRKMVVGVIVVIVGGLVLLVYNGVNKQQTATLGDSTGLRNPISEQDLPREKPDFNLLTPGGVGGEEYDVVRISPPEADASYTFLDRMTEDGKIFRVTQQEVPVNFDLEKTATDFQASSVIQVDDNRIYHGYAEKNGIQSLIFVKDKKLISIRSPQKFTDDVWASYYLSLK